MINDNFSELDQNDPVSGPRDSQLQGTNVPVITRCPASPADTLRSPTNGEVLLSATSLQDTQMSTSKGFPPECMGTPSGEVVFNFRKPGAYTCNANSVSNPESIYNELIGLQQQVVQLQSRLSAFGLDKPRLEIVQNSTQQDISQDMLTKGTRPNRLDIEINELNVIPSGLHSVSRGGFYPENEHSKSVIFHDEIPNHDDRNCRSVPGSTTQSRNLVQKHVHKEVEFRLPSGVPSDNIRGAQYTNSRSVDPSMMKNKSMGDDFIKTNCDRRSHEGSSVPTGNMPISSYGAMGDGFYRYPTSTEFSSARDADFDDPFITNHVISDDNNEIGNLNITDHGEKNATFCRQPELNRNIQRNDCNNNYHLPPERTLHNSQQSIYRNGSNLISPIRNPTFISNHSDFYKQPATYDGKSSFHEYLIQFEMVAELNYWDKTRKALELATSLRGTAREVLGDLAYSTRHNYESLVHALMMRFDPKNQSELHRAEMKSKLRKRGESLGDLAQDIKKTTRYAYPYAGTELREQLAIGCFIDSLNDEDLEWAVYQNKPKTLEDALRLSLEYEAFQKGRKQRVHHKQYVRLQYENKNDTSEKPITESLKTSSVPPAAKHSLHKTYSKNPQSANGLSDQRKPGICHYCGKPGHWKAECRKLKRDRETAGNNIPAQSHYMKPYPSTQQNQTLNYP